MSRAKACSTGGKPDCAIKAVITLGKPSAKVKSHHMAYGIEHEDTAVRKYIQQLEADGHQVTAQECGLFVHPDHNQLAASPDRIVTVDGHKITAEIKCLSGSRQGTPLDAIRTKAGKASFALKFVSDTDTVVLKENHAYYHQVQMQMAVVGVKACDFVVFTNCKSPVLVVRVPFDESWWSSQQKKLVKFHDEHIMPALVLLQFGKENAKK